MGALRAVVRILSYICYVIIGIYAIICLPMLTGARPVVVLSGSMRPTYEVGSIIYYKHADKAEIQTNDVITYDMDGTLVTHRIKRIENGNYVTQGDANNTEDGKPVEYESIQGKVGGIAIPFLGFGVQFINTNMWLFIVIVAILFAEFLLSNIKNGKINTSEKGLKQKDDG